MKKEIAIIIQESGIRIDKLITAELEDISRSAVQSLFLSGAVTKQGKALTKNTKLQVGDEITITLPEEETLQVEAENIPLDIIYEDEDLLIVNKPKGMVVHPAPGNHTGTLVNALLYHCKGALSGLNGSLRPGIVHRIDKDTSGLLIVAKNDFSHRSLAEQIQVHSIQREYHCIVYGCPKVESGQVCAPIGRSPKNRKKMGVILDGENAKEALTYYQVLQAYPKFTHLSCRLETGRTHQIRVHMAYLGHPIVGDAVYGPKKAITELRGQCLHARLIGFVHPRTQKKMLFTIPLPAYFQHFLAKINPE